MIRENSYVFEILPLDPDKSRYKAIVPEIIDNGLVSVIMNQPDTSVGTQ